MPNEAFNQQRLVLLLRDIRLACPHGLFITYNRMYRTPSGLAYPFYVSPPNPKVYGNRFFSPDTNPPYPILGDPVFINNAFYPGGVPPYTQSPGSTDYDAFFRLHGPRFDVSESTTSAPILHPPASPWSMSFLPPWPPINGTEKSTCKFRRCLPFRGSHKISINFPKRNKARMQVAAPRPESWRTDYVLPGRPTICSWLSQLQECLNDDIRYARGMYKPSPVHPLLSPYSNLIWDLRHPYRDAFRHQRALLPNGWHNLDAFHILPIPSSIRIIHTLLPWTLEVATLPGRRSIRVKDLLRAIDLFLSTTVNVEDLTGLLGDVQRRKIEAAARRRDHRNPVIKRVDFLVDNCMFLYLELVGKDIFRLRTTRGYNRRIV